MELSSGTYAASTAKAAPAPIANGGSGNGAIATANSKGILMLGMIFRWAVIIYYP